MVRFHYLCRNAIFDKTVNYNLGVFFKNGVENQNCSIFANMYVYMSCGCTAKTSVIACLVFLKTVAKYRSHPLAVTYTYHIHEPTSSM